MYSSIFIITDSHVSAILERESDYSIEVEQIHCILYPFLLGNKCQGSTR